MINILDSMMGTGKTTGIFKMMKDNQEGKRYLYISLFLDEVGDGNTGTLGRIQKELPEMNFKMPKNLGDGKLKSLKDMVSMGYNIASTHSLFGIFDNELVEMLVSSQYTLIIDEAVDCISLFDEVNKSDVQMILSGEIATVQESGRLIWNEVRYPEHEGKYRHIRELCALGSLYLHNNVVLIWEYPPKLLELLQEVYIITYLFEGSIMSSWMKINNLPYEYLDNDSLGLKSESEVKRIAKENLTFLSSPSLEKFKQNRYTFSSGWHEGITKDKAKAVKSILRSTMVGQEAKSGDIFWTSFLSSKTKLQGAGYTKAVRGGLEPFLPFNTKATNNYRNYWLCMYTVNLFKNPIEVGYLRSRGVEFNEDDFALSQMIQFIWRGCIREGKPMKVLILSNRMRSLLEGWLNG